ncbi:MAG: hypothetical protein JWP01_2555 [Myxococcales bacterium]|nr:hypothetical protein [Myxococcales bacterium]
MPWFRKKKPLEVDLEQKVSEYVNERVDAMGSYLCDRCGEEHVQFELAFRWPDFAVVGGIADESEPDDAIRIEGRRYVRGTLRIPIAGTSEEFAVGLWAMCEDATHGRIANQCALLAPLLGAAVQIIPGSVGRRVTFMLTDHPLATLQREGATQQQVTRWRSDEAHRDDEQPLGAPFVATLAIHGWELATVDEAGKPPCEDDIAVGDFAKIVVRLTTVGEGGRPTQINAGWWIAVDRVEEERLSGTLHSVPSVPTTLSHGTRIWAARNQIFQRQRT